AVVVVADHGRAGMARSAAAGIARGAGVPVIATRRVRGKQASGGRVTRVVGAAVVVVADHGRAGMARSAAARIARGAGVPVIAWCGVVGEHASRGPTPRFAGPAVVVVADHGRAGMTRSAAAGIARGTG